MSLSSSIGATDPSNGSSDANADVATLSYERAREELVSVVQRLEAGQVPLEEERGEALAARCQAWLDDARTRLAAVAEREKAPS